MITVDIAEIPYATYDVYAYLLANQIDRGGSVTTDNSSNTFFYRNDSTLGTFVQATETGSFAAASFSNYALFEGLSGTSFKMTLTIDTVQVMLAGLQVVEVAPVPEPSAFVLGILALAGLGFIGWRRRGRMTG